MPGVLLTEAIAQVGGIALLYPEENRVLLLCLQVLIKCVSAIL